jgi:hypothetical protein
MRLLPSLQSTSALGPTQLPVRRTPESISLKNRAEQSPFSVDVRNVWSCRPIHLPKLNTAYLN